LALKYKKPKVQLTFNKKKRGMMERRKILKKNLQRLTQAHKQQRMWILLIFTNQIANGIENM